MTEKRTGKYRCTKVVTTDYGPSSGKRTNEGPLPDASAEATIVRLPDGSHWSRMPAAMSFSVPVGTRPGTIWNVTIELETPHE